MSVRHCKTKATAHALSRMRERGVVGDGSDKARCARMYGVNLFEIEKNLGADSQLAMFVAMKQGSGKKVKLYGGYVYVFFSTSDRCITCYKLPDCYDVEYALVRWIETKHREDYKRSKRK